VRFQTAAFDVKRNQQLCLSYWYDCSLGHTFLATLLGTLGAFLGFVCQKTEGKRGNATVFQTAAIGTPPSATLTGNRLIAVRPAIWAHSARNTGNARAGMARGLCRCGF
jgi:hypothetical protein